MRRRSIRKMTRKYEKGCGLRRTRRVSASMCVLIIAPMVCLTQLNVQAEWQTQVPGSEVIREPGEPLHMLMTNNESFSEAFHYESMMMLLPRGLKLGAIVEATVINHANSNYPIIPALTGYFQAESERFQDVVFTTITNSVGTTWAEPTLPPNGTYVIVAKKFAMSDPYCGYCTAVEGLSVRLNRENPYVPSDQPANTTVYVTSILKVLDPGEDTNQLAEFLNDPIALCLGGLTLLICGVCAWKLVKRSRRIAASKHHPGQTQEEGRRDR